jgi:hypothetical protein
MRLPGAAEQQNLVPYFRADGSITAGGTPQLILPRAAPRSSLIIQNVSDTDMWFEFGGARATATLTSGKVTSITVTNGGFGFTYPPTIQFMGGGANGNGRFLGVGYPGQNSPSKPARAHCVLTSGVVTSIVVDDGGSGYATAPYVQLLNDANDPFGCADPSSGSGSGILLSTGKSVYLGHTIVSTDALAVYCASSSKKFTVMYTT